MSFQGSIGEKEQCGLEQSKGALKQQGLGPVPWRWAAGGRTRLAGPRPAVLRENKSAEKRENEFHQAQITLRQSKAPRASQGQESRPGRAAGTPWARFCSRALQEGLHCSAPAQPLPSWTAQEEIVSCLHNALQKLDLVYKSDRYSMTHHTGINAI